MRKFFQNFRGVRRKPGEMNKTESAYALHLTGKQQDGEILWFKFDVLTLKLATDTRYTPDFLVMLSDGTMELHEVKGRKKVKGEDRYIAYCEEDAKIKIKVAAALFPFRFVMVFPMKDGSWNRHEFCETESMPQEKPGMVRLEV